MKKLKRFTALLSLTLAFTILIPQIPVIPSNTMEAKAATVKLNKKKATLYKGKTLQLKVSGTKKKATWKSSNRKVAVVSSKGKVKAKKKGTTTITAKVGTKKLSCKVTVESPSINRKSAILYTGGKISLKINGTKQKVSWKTSNKNVASVNNQGIVTAKNIGTATITGTVLGKIFKCQVTVKDSFNINAAKRNISVKPYLVQDGAIAFVKNNYSMDVTIDVSFAFYDKNGSLIKTKKDTYLSVAKGMTSIAYGKTFDDDAIPAATVKTSISRIEKSSAINQPEKIQISENNISEEYITCKIDNNGKNYDFIQLSCVFFKDGIPVGHSDDLLSDFASGATDYISFDIPIYKKYYYDEDGYYDYTYEKIDFDNYKIYVDYACYYVY